LAYDSREGVSGKKYAIMKRLLMGRKS
jgi:hypothetical protein